MARNFHHVVRTAIDFYVRLVVLDGLVRGVINFRTVLAPVRLFIFFRIVVNSPEHPRGKRFCLHEITLFFKFCFLSVLVPDLKPCSGERSTRDSGYERPDSRQGSYKYATCFSLPPRVQNRTTTASYLFKVPHPGLLSY